ncbi:N-acetyltransferase [Ornithinimicrobium faecis]|uniref:N-acetyltransferase n=1 Tax=Ornithinimicrobium faecis TaxID=2934158 RepID=UPI00211754BD|nr:N-acetyltransferase [Ornithinimicrobium sp. HY1745]
MPAVTPPPIARVDLRQVLREAAGGTFPAADGGFSRATPWGDGVEAAVAFTGHAVLVVGEDVSDEHLRSLGVHGLGGAHDPRATVDLAGQGEIGILDALLVGRGTGGAGTGAQSILVDRPDLAQSHRAQHAAQWRHDIRVYGLADPARTALVTLGRGIAGLPELGLQADDGSADELLAGLLSLVPAGDVVLASVSPGNARSLRFFLRRGFVPVGSVQLWHPAR